MNELQRKKLHFFLHVYTSIQYLFLSLQIFVATERDACVFYSIAVVVIIVFFLFSDFRWNFFPPLAMSIMHDDGNKIADWRHGEYSVHSNSDMANNNFRMHVNWMNDIDIWIYCDVVSLNFGGCLVDCPRFNSLPTVKPKSYTFLLNFYIEICEQKNKNPNFMLNLEVKKKENYNHTYARFESHFKMHFFNLETRYISPNCQSKIKSHNSFIERSSI